MTPDDDSFFSMLGAEVWDGDDDDITVEGGGGILATDTLPTEDSFVDIVLRSIKRILFGG